MVLLLVILSFGFCEEMLLSWFLFIWVCTRGWFTYCKSIYCFLIQKQEGLFVLRGYRDSYLIGFSLNRREMNQELVEWVVECSRCEGKTTLINFSSNMRWHLLHERALVAVFSDTHHEVVSSRWCVAAACDEVDVWCIPPLSRFTAAIHHRRLRSLLLSRMIDGTRRSLLLLHRRNVPRVPIVLELIFVIWLWNYYVVCFAVFLFDVWFFSTWITSVLGLLEL